MRNNTNLALLILRLGFGGLMLTHGFPKLSMLINNPTQFTLDPIGIGSTLTLILAVLGEVVAPILIMIGFRTKWAAIPAFITMFIAAFVVHANDAIGVKETALLYLFAFLAIFFAGPGKFSIDKDSAR